MRLETVAQTREERNALLIIWFQKIISGEINWKKVKNKYGEFVKSLDQALTEGDFRTGESEKLKEAILQARIKVLYHHPKINPGIAVKIMKGNISLNSPPPKPNKAEKDLVSRTVERLIDIYCANQYW